MRAGQKPRDRAPRFLIGFSGLVLVGTAAFHASGYPSVVESVVDSGLEDFFQRAVPGLWLFFSWHLLALAAACLWAAMRGGRAARALVSFVAVVVTVDLLWVLRLAGFFPGTALLALAAACSIVAGVVWKRVDR